MTMCSQVDKWTKCLYSCPIMSNHQGLTISQYAQLKGISTKTVRRRIKAGELAYEMSKGKYLITDIPYELERKVVNNVSTPVQKVVIDNDVSSPVKEVDNKNDLSIDMSTPVKEVDNKDVSMDMSSLVKKVDNGNDMSTIVKDLLGQIQRLTEENRNLAITLGRYQAKIESLEIKLIATSKPWWRRIFGRGG
jgi:predicted RNase H-like nuclease (RuvC/YqgF family)